jgi:hypothetical protein
MAKDHEKYIYVEVALPRDHPAVQNLVNQSEVSAIPLRVLVKSAAILAYATDEERTETSPKIVKPAKKKRTKGGDPVISDAARESASNLLDDMGF